MALKFDMDAFSKATATLNYTPQQPTNEVAEQQATSPLPPTENTQPTVEPTTSVQPQEPQRSAEQVQRDTLFSENKNDFISQMNQHYGISPEIGQNRYNYAKLNEQMRNDGLTTEQMREVQQQWIKSVEAYRDSLPGGKRKDDITAQLETIKSAPMTYKEDTWLNKAKEEWRNATPATEAQVEHVYNAASQYVPGLGSMSDREILEKYDPEFLKKVDAAGGITYLSQIGQGANINEITNVNEDGWGVGGMLTSGATKEQQDLGKELLAKIDNYRATETLSREDKEGEEVILPNGKKVKMSNRQAADYYSKQESSIAGRKEWQERFDKDPLGSIRSLSDVGNLTATMLGSSIRNAPTIVAGTAAGFFHPALGLAVINSGNITDQELQYVNKAISDEYKKQYGKDAEVSKLSADEYAKFAQELAKNGVISKASAEGILTGGLMTLAETATGGIVDSIGAKAIAKMTPKELTNTLGKKLSNIAFGSVGLGLKVSDEGLQEVASTIVENARAGKKLDDGLTQSFLLGAFSIENVAQHTVRGVGKARELASKDKEQATNQSESQEAPQPETTTENTAGSTPESTPESTPDNTQSPTASTSEVSNKPNSTTSPNSPITEDKAKLLREYEHIINNADEDGNLSDEDAKRAKQIEDQFYNEDGTNTLQSDLNAWVKNGRQATTQGNQDEHRADNRDGTPNADGATIGQGLDVTNGSGAERSSETSEQVSPTQTETTTEGNSQSNTQPTSDFIGQPHDLTQESSATGLDGRTSETDTVRGEQGELGQNGSKQGGEPTQATSETSTDSGVQQRSQSDSVGETLAPEGRKNGTRNRKRDSGSTEQSESQSALGSGEQTSVSNERTETISPSDTTTPTRSTDATSVSKSERKDSGEETLTPDERLAYPSFMTDEEIITSKNRLKEFAKEAKKNAHTREFLAARKGTFKSKAEMVDAMQKAMSEHLEDTELNADLFKHASSLIDQHKGRKGWGKNSAELALPKGAKMSLTNVIGSAEKAHRQEVGNSATEQVANVEPSPVDDLVSEIKAFKGKPKAEDVSAFRDKARELKASLNPKVRSAINKLADKLDDDEYLAYADTEQRKREERKEKAYKEVEDAIKGERTYEKSELTAIKKEEPKENSVANFNKENRINSAIDNAIASEEETVKPYLKEFKTGDLRSNQKRASELLKNNPKDADKIKEAFFDRTPNARPASWGVVERGYIRFDIRNPNHKSFRGTRVGLLGFDFDGNAVYGTEEMAFDDIKKSDTAEDITTITLAQQPKDTRETTDKAVENVIRTNPELEQDMRDVVEEFARENDILEEDGSPVQGTNENIAWASNNSDFMSWLEKGSKALHAMFKKVQNVLAGVLAVVAVGAMTVPNDAMAHTGYSVYESGPKIENVSQQASDTINWVVKQKDHNGKAFVVADKAQGKILIVDTDGKVLDSQNAIFGKNKGDSTAFGNTPSGRFQLHKTETKNLSDVDKRVFGDSVLDLTDKETGRKVTNEKGQVVAMHRVVNTKQRHAALNSATANDNYLSHGCINVPTAFYNSANSKLDGAMVYVLNQDGSSNMSDTKGKTKFDVSSTSNEHPQSSNTKKTGVKSSNLKLDNHTGLNVAKKSSLKFSVKAKDITNVTGSVSVDKLRKALDHALGDLANNVNFITAKDYGNTQGFDKIRNAGVEGFYDPINKQVYIVADNIEAQNGLSAEERMAWVAWHELVHNGLDVKHGEELGNILYKVQGNSFISQLADAIMQDRRDNQLAEIGYDKATEEALSELGAAIKTGKVKALASRYKVELPLEYQGGLKAIIGKHLVSLRQLISKVLGKKVFTTKQVERLLEDALKEVKPDEATKAFAEKALADINDPESAFTKSVMFSVADKAKNFVKDVSHVISGGDISRTGSTPARDGTKAAKERTTRQGFISRLWTGIQDSQQVIIDLDPEGNGGRLSNAVATFSNKAAQMGRRYRSRIKNLEMKFNKFATENKDLFPNRRDRRQIDHIVQDVTSSLRTITGGNEQIRKRVENTIFGEDIYDNNGNFIKHIPGLADRVQEYSEYIANAKAQGLVPSSYITARLNEYTKLLDDQIEIQNTFDKSDGTIIQRSNAANDTSRKNWRGHDGFTTAEAEQKLRDLKAKGFIDIDVDSLTKVPYQVKRFVKGVNGQPDSFTVETHYRYETKDVKAVAKGRIMPLVDEYVALSQDMYQEAVNLVGKDIMGDAPSEEWQVGTMGKVRNAYTTQAKDANGNVIDGVYDVSQNSNIDNIISLRQAAEYQSRLNGRAFNGGTALENLTWHVELMSKQAASKHIGKVMYDLWQDQKTNHLIKVYRRNDKDYSSQNGILITRDKVVGGRVVRDANGNPVQEVIKVAFADEEANRALFGDNIAREEITNGNLIARALFGTLSSLTKLGSLGLTGSVGFSIANAVKGYNEKLNQMLAWSSDSPFVKSMPQDIQDKYFAKGAIKGLRQGTKLQATTALHKYANTANLKHMYDMQLASTIFAQELIDNNGKIVQGLKAVKGLSKGAEREYQKLVYMYEQGGISSRVEELINSSKELKLRFATGPRAAKWSGKASKVLETAASVTMSQELVSSLMMFDLLTGTLGMPPEKAVEANLHFMNFNKRGTWKIMDYIRKYTMFGNAIAQGSKAFQNAWIEQTNDPNHKLFGWFGPVGYTISDRAIGRSIRNIAIGMGMNLAARMLAENVCGGSHKDVGSPFDSLNPYELMRDIPIAYNCGEKGPDYFRFPVEYGTGNVENAIGVGVAQVINGAWSAEQALDFAIDSLRDNALPISMPVMKTKDPFQLAVSFLMPLVPEPAKGAVLAFGGIDSFGNPLNSMSYQFKDYKPATGKATTDEAWTELAESLYGVGIFGNLSPEQAKVLTTSWTQGVFRDMLTHAVENDPKGSLWSAILGYKSLARDAKGYDKIAYTMAQTYLQSRYGDINEIAIKAEGTGNPNPSTKWLEENGYEMDEKESKLLKQVLKYRATLRDKSASQERRYKNNVEFIQSMRKIEGYDDN